MVHKRCRWRLRPKNKPNYPKRINWAIVWVSSLSNNIQVSLLCKREITFGQGRFLPFCALITHNSLSLSLHLKYNYTISSSLQFCPWIHFQCNMNIIWTYSSCRTVAFPIWNSWGEDIVRNERQLCIRDRQLRAPSSMSNGHQECL